MKRLMIYTGLILMMGFGLTGCYKDVILPDAAVDTDAPPQAISFKTDIAPLVATHCALAGCTGTGAHKPIMTTPGSYE